MLKIRKFNTVFFFLLIVLFSLTYSYSKDFYKWTDENGKVHYTTNPGSVPKSEKDNVESFKGRDSKYTDELNQNNFQDSSDLNSNIDLDKSINQFIITDVESSFITKIGFNSSMNQLYIEIENVKLSEKVKELVTFIKNNSGENRKYLSDQEISRNNFFIKNQTREIRNYYDQERLLKALNKEVNGENRLYLSDQEISSKQHNIKLLRIRMQNNNNKQKKIYKYLYSEVPETVYIDFLNSPSKGEYYNYNIKGIYRSTKIY